MTQIEKLRQRLLNARGDSSYADVRRILEHHGWVETRQRGSHVMLRKHGEGRLSIPLITGRRAKRVYVQDVLERLNNQE